MPKLKEITQFDETAEWFEKSAESAGLSYLLAFSDDQVILGWLKKKKLVSSSKIDVHTLQRAHLFGKAGELRLLRKETGFETVWLEDGDRAPENMQDEHYPLWRKEQQGLSYSLPAQFTGIEVRHYIDYDEQGQAYFSHSRLVGFTGGEK